MERKKRTAPPVFSIASTPPRRYLKLSCDTSILVLYIGIVDSNYQGLSSVGRSDGLSVGCVKSLGFEFGADCERVAPYRHMACAHIAEAAGLKHAGRRPVRHPRAKLGEQVTHFRCCPPRNDLPERKFLTELVRLSAAAARPVPPTAKSEGTEYCLNAFGSDILNALRSATFNARLSAQGVGVRLTVNYLDLHSAQQLLTLFESQPDLLRRQIGDRASDCANVVGDWRVTVWRQLNPDRPFHRGSPPLLRGRLCYPCAPTYVPLPLIRVPVPSLRCEFPP